jgi:hypothetical protein
MTTHNVYDFTVLKLEVARASETLDWDKVLEHAQPIVTPKVWSLHVWDAWFEIEGDNLVLRGAVDAAGFGEITIKLPKAEADRYYKFELDFFGEDVVPQVISECKAKGYEVTATN